MTGTDRLVFALDEAGVAYNTYYGFFDKRSVRALDIFHALLSKLDLSLIYASKERAIVNSIKCGPVPQILFDFEKTETLDEIKQFLAVVELFMMLIFRIIFV